MAKCEKNLRKIEEEQHSFINSLALNSHIKVRLNNQDIICKIIEIRQIHFIKKKKRLPNQVMNIIFIISALIADMTIGLNIKI